MRYLPRALLAGGLGFAVSCLAACGGGAGLLSGDQAGTLSNRLDQISSGLQDGDCQSVNNASRGLITDVNNLPATVNGTVRANLSQGASTVAQLATQQCRPATTPTPTTASTATTATKTTTTPSTASTATTSTTPTTSSTATTPTAPGTTSTQPTGGGGLSGGASGTTTGGGASPGNGNGNGQ